MQWSRTDEQQQQTLIRRWILIPPDCCTQRDHNWISFPYLGHIALTCLPQAIEIFDAASLICCKRQAQSREKLPPIRHKVQTTDLSIAF